MNGDIQKGRPKVVCACAIRNEEWILDAFIRHNSKWADTFVFRDQCSQDASIEIIKRTPSAKYFSASNDNFDEAVRRQELLEHAREANPDVIIVLDADEILVGDFRSKDWLDFLAAPKGTVGAMRWPQYYQGHCVEHSAPTRFAIVDDGRTYDDAPRIHTPRIPVVPNEIVNRITGVSVLHLQYLPEKRNRSKQYFYQCQEKVLNPSRSPTCLFRQYNRPLDMTGDMREPTQTEIAIVEELTSAIGKSDELSNTYDLAVIELFKENGPSHFSALNIWDNDWVKLGERYGFCWDQSSGDTRTLVQRLLHYWLNSTKLRSQNVAVRFVDKLLRMTGL